MVDELRICGFLKFINSVQRNITESVLDSFEISSLVRYVKFVSDVELKEDLF